MCEARIGCGPFLPGCYLVISALQPGCPHWQAISEVSLCDSQCVLQNFWSVMQEQAGWAHFFLSAMSLFLLLGMLSDESLSLDATSKRFAV